METKKYFRILNQEEEPNLHDPDQNQVIQEILRKSQKSKKEFEFLKKWLIQIPVFQRNQNVIDNLELVKKLAQKLQIEKIEKYNPVMQIGELGEKFYIILQGECFILLPSLRVSQMMPPSKKDSLTMISLQNELQQNKKQIFEVRKSNQLTANVNRNSSLNNLPSNQFLGDSIPKKQESFIDKISQEAFEQLNKQESMKEDLLFLQTKYSSLRLQQIAKQGQSFGDIALISNKGRTATIICRIDCIFLTLDKNSYETLIGEAERQQMHKRTQFLKEFWFMQDISRAKIMSMIIDIKPIIGLRNQCIYKEDEPIEYIFFIHHGQCVLSQEIDKEKYILKDDYPKEREFDPESKIFSLSKVQKRRKNKEDITRIELLTLEDGGYFGDLEMVLNSDKRMSRVVCTQDNTLIQAFPKNILYERLMENSENYYKFEKQGLIRYDWMQERIRNAVNKHRNKEKVMKQTFSQDIGKTQTQSISNNKDEEIKYISLNNNINRYNKFSSQQLVKQFYKNFPHDTIITRFSDQQKNHQQQQIQKLIFISKNFSKPKIKHSNHTSLDQSKISNIPSDIIKFPTLNEQNDQKQYSISDHVSSIQTAHITPPTDQQNIMSPKFINKHFFLSQNMIDKLGVDLIQKSNKHYNSQSHMQSPKSKILQEQISQVFTRKKSSEFLGKLFQNKIKKKGYVFQAKFNPEHSQMPLPTIKYPQKHDLKEIMSKMIKNNQDSNIQKSKQTSLHFSEINYQDINKSKSKILHNGKMIEQ